MKNEIVLDIAGFGIILYSPPAVRHIQEGSDYLEEAFWHPEDVARHVMASQITTFCTGSPGRFRLRFLDSPLDERRVGAADFKLRLGLQVQCGAICVRDLFDLLQWEAECPQVQRVPVPDGWYRLTVFSSLPSSGLRGDDQLIEIHLEPTAGMPPLRWEGVPHLD